MFDYPEDEKSIQQDTALPSDLYEHLERRKEQRLNAVATTEGIAKFFLGWSLNATGFFLARALLYIGGSTNLWLAITLSFTIGSTSAFANLQKVNANYRGGEGGLEVTGGEKLVNTATGLGLSGLTTFLAVKDFLYYQQISDQTIVQIEHDIDELQEPSIWGEPWALLTGVLIILLLIPKFFIRRRRD